MLHNLYYVSQINDLEVPMGSINRDEEGVVSAY
jgi:hypothetical protein